MSPAAGGPLLSIVVPVHDVAAWLPACLDSILGQPGPAIEVIAVDDASGDGSARILDDRAAADPRLRVVHLSRNGGQGPARNAGLALAAGEYVWFADGDDYLAEGALTSIASALRRPGPRPDVVLLNWVSCYPGGRIEAAPGQALLAAVPGEGTTLAARPELLELTMTAWSKLLRREFLAGLGVGFSAGIHEDVVVSCAALLAARSITAVPALCYCYRRDRPGSAMTGSTGHGAIFDAYAQVRVLAAEAPGAVRAALFGRAIWHYATLLDAGGRGARLVPRGERRRFFARMHAEFRGSRPAGYQYPAGARGARFALIERGWYPGYVTAGVLNRLRLAARARARGHE